MSFTEELENTPGFEGWMRYWVFTKGLDLGDGIINTIYTCYGPEGNVFYASSSLEDAVNALKTYTYKG